MDRLKNVLVGVDGTAASGVALREALRLARPDGATVHVLHVQDTTVVDDLKESIGASAEVDRRVVDAARAAVDRLLADAEPGDLRTDVRVEIGSAVDALLRRGRDVPADLVVLGARASEGLGPVTLKVVRDARTPVLVVREDHRPPWRRVVACVDFSDTSRLVVDEAARIAKAEGATLHVLHVFAPPWELLLYPSPSPEAAAGYRERFVAAQHRYMDGLVTTVAAASPELAVKTHVLEDPRPGRGIVEFLRAQRADLAVVGTRGRSKLAYLVLGTTAARILRAAPCSVLAVRPAGGTDTRSATAAAGR